MVKKTVLQEALNEIRRQKALQH